MFYPRRLDDLSPGRSLGLDIGRHILRRAGNRFVTFLFQSRTKVGHLQDQALARPLIWLSPPLWGTSPRFPCSLRRIYNRHPCPDSAIPYYTSGHNEPNTRLPMPIVFWDSDLRCPEIARRQLRTEARKTYRLSTYASTTSPLKLSTPCTMITVMAIRYFN